MGRVPLRKELLQRIAVEDSTPSWISPATASVVIGNYVTNKYDTYTLTWVVKDSRRRNMGNMGRVTLAGLHAHGQWAVAWQLPSLRSNPVQASSACTCNSSPRLT